MKHLVILLLLLSCHAFAMDTVDMPTSKPETMEQIKRKYLDEMSSELDHSENQLDAAKVNSGTDPKAVDDLKLLIKEARGDISKLKAETSPLREGARAALESKIDDIRSQIKSAREEAPKSNAAKRGR